MSQILVRDLAPETVDKLKERARRNKRSLQSEVRDILEDAAAAAEREAERRRHLDEFLRVADWSRKVSGPQSTDSVDLIREDRER